MSGRGLPSLAALRAFEAAARRGSFQAAAEELYLTPSAISHQVRRLENELDSVLFERAPRGVTLTPAGRAYADSVRSAFDLLRQGTDALRARVEPILRVTTAPLFATRFLMPHLGQFEAEHRPLKVQLEMTHELRSLGDSDAAVGIRFGGGHWLGLRSESLVQTIAGPACAEALVDFERGPEQLRDATLLHVEPKRQAWQIWLAEAGVPDLEPARELVFDSLSSAVAAAQANQGWVILPDYFAGQGTAPLVQPFGVRVRSSDTYFLVARPERWDMSTIAGFRSWLAAVVAEELRGRP